MANPMRATQKGRAKPLPRKEQLVEGVLPKHVEHCKHHPNSPHEWYIWTWDPQKPGTKVRIPYSCNSWRCPVCRRHEAAVTFARIRDAFEPYQASDLVFWTLTLDRESYYGGKRWKDEREAYRALSEMSRKLWKRINRLCERNGWERPGSRWVGAVEAHRSGWPHYHAVMVCPELAQHLREQQEAARIGRLSEREGKLVQGDILEHVVASGWGRQSTAEPVEGGSEAMAGYLTKLSGELDSTTGEIAKLTQLPLNAPVKTRRIRSGKGFLPPRRKSNWTGVMVRRRMDLMAGAYDVLTMNVIKRRPEESAEEYSERMRHIEQACQLEEREADRERDVEVGRIVDVKKWNEHMVSLGRPELVRRVPEVIRYTNGVRSHETENGGSESGGGIDDADRGMVAELAGGVRRAVGYDALNHCAKTEKGGVVSSRNVVSDEQLQLHY